MERLLGFRGKIIVSIGNFKVSFLRFIILFLFVMFFVGVLEIFVVELKIRVRLIGN